MTRFRLPGQRGLGRLGLLALAACGAPLPTSAQTEGGLYVAGAGFSFEQAADDGLSRNPGGQRFFLLALPPQTDALTSKASRAQAAARQRVVDGNGVLLVCRRDIDNGAVDASRLVPGVVPVRGWPPSGSGELPAGQRYFPDEDRANLPQSDELLRRLRSTCS
jgi:hypothetical protein